MSCLWILGRPYRCGGLLWYGVNFVLYCIFIS
jgi:hypothetical protein